jgi:phage tail tape-measure protein
VANYNTSITLRGVDKLSGPSKKMADSLKRLGGAMGAMQDYGKRMRILPPSFNEVRGKLGAVRSQFGDTAKHVGKLGLGLAALGGGALALVKTQLVDTAAQFEKFQAILETTEGSSDKAQTAMRWVEDFTKKTPFKIEEVMESFVKLRAYGLDPTKGLLETLGDTGAAMGKPVLQAVEAIADAVTGENERLKEFGIKASTKGDTITYSYTNAAGEQLSKTASKKSRAQIQETLEAIWNEKYGGAMQKQAKTFEGMWSMISDHFVAFKRLIMSEGVFDLLKGELQKLLDTANRLAADGTLKKWAQQIAAALKVAITWVKDKGVPGFLSLLETIGSAIEFVGGFKNALVGVAVVMSASTILSVGKLVWSLLSLGASLSKLIFLSPTVTAALSPALLAIKGWAAAAWAAAPATLAAAAPFIAVAAAVGAVVLAVRQLIHYWDKLNFAEVWEGMKATLGEDGFLSTVGQLLDPRALFSDIGDMVGIGGEPVAAAAAGANGATVDGLIKVQVEGAAKVKSIQSNGPVDLDADAGLAMVGGP